MSGSFGLGGGESSSQSQSQSVGQSFGVNTSNSVSQSTGVAQATNTGQSTSGQSVAFQDLYNQLYGGATSAAGALAQNTGQLSNAASMLFSGGTDFLSQLGGGGAGNEFLTNQLTDDSALNGQIGALGTDLGNFFNQQLLPGITSDSVGNGSLGGGRQGVAQGLAAQSVANSFASQSATLRANDLQSKDVAAQALMTNQTQSDATGLSALPSLYNLASSGFGASLQPYQTLSSILGGPTTLANSQSTQYGQSTSDQIAQAISQAFGQTSAYDESGSNSASKAWNISVSGGGGV